MRIWYLTHLADSPSNPLLAEAARVRGHDWLRLDPAQVVIELDGVTSRCWTDGRALDWPEAFFTRLGSSADVAGLNLVRLLEERGIPGMNAAAGIAIARDKAATLTRLAGQAIAHPRTVLAGSARALDAAMTVIPGPPWIIKLPIGTQGLGTVIAESPASLRSIGELLLARERCLLVQEFIAEAEAADLRVFVVGGAVKAAMRRRGRAGEFRSNLHRGGSAEAIEIDDRTAQTALRAARALDLDVAGVDILESAKGPLVIEVNAAPGLAGIEAATGRDLAGAILDQLTGP